MASKQKNAASAMEIDRLATQLAKDPQSKAFLPLAEEYCKVGMWEEAVSVLEAGLKYYPGFITAMVALGRAYDQLNQPTKARAVLEGAVKLSPENLRAHRTLIKIYTTQGLNDAALQSCSVILAMNPKDEEALSVQGSLGLPSKAETEKPKQSIPLQIKSTTPETACDSEPELPPRPTSLTKPVQVSAEESAVPEEAATHAVEEDLRVDEPIAILDEIKPENSPISLATSIMDAVLHEKDHKLVEPQATADVQPELAGSPPTPSPHAGTIAQLESWLRSIERQRRDRVTSGDAGA